MRICLKKDLEDYNIIVNLFEDAYLIIMVGILHHRYHSTDILSTWTDVTIQGGFLVNSQSWAPFFSVIFEWRPL